VAGDLVRFGGDIGALGFSVEAFIAQIRLAYFTGGIWSAHLKVPFDYVGLSACAKAPKMPLRVI
jgi:hypothetical protein